MIHTSLHPPNSAHARGESLMGNMQCLAVLCQRQTLPDDRLPDASVESLVVLKEDWVATLKELSEQLVGARD